MFRSSAVRLLAAGVSIDFVNNSRLDVFVVPPRPRGIVLLLHGGQQNSFEPVRNRHASWWRMALLARSLQRFARRENLAVYLLQNRVRGWNAVDDPSPVRDGREAIEQVATAHPGTPVVLVGHSMGGRTACRVANAPQVVGVVGLAPWLPLGEPHLTLTSRALHVLHGTADKWTSPQESRQFVERCRPITTVATWQPMPGAGHFMLRRPSKWKRFVKESVLDILDSVTSRADAANKGSS